MSQSPRASADMCVSTSTLWVQIRAMAPKGEHERHVNQIVQTWTVGRMEKQRERRPGLRLDGHGCTPDGRDRLGCVIRHAMGVPAVFAKIPEHKSINLCVYAARATRAHGVRARAKPQRPLPSAISRSKSKGDLGRPVRDLYGARCAAAPRPRLWCSICRAQ